jgi:hypothetical protein
VSAVIECQLKRVPVDRQLFHGNLLSSFLSNELRLALHQAHSNSTWVYVVECRID